MIKVFSKGLKALCILFAVSQQGYGAEYKSLHQRWDGSASCASGEDKALTEYAAAI